MPLMMSLIEVFFTTGVEFIIGSVTVLCVK